MRKLITISWMFALLGGLVFGGAVSEEEALEEILALELGTYETWYGKSDPTAYAELFADKATYIEPWSENRIEDGAVKEYMMALAGQIPNFDYKILNPRVDLYGKTAVFVFILETSDGGTITGLAKGTAVFTRTKDSWEKVHAHFSFSTPLP